MEVVNAASDKAVYAWDEIVTHSKKDSRWLVIEDAVYDVTKWSHKHPGGSALLGHFAGQNATEAFQAFHRGSIQYVRKFLKPLYIGKVDNGKPLPDTDVIQDFDKLRKTAEKMGLFEASYWFFALIFLHILLFDAASYLVLLYFGTGWLAWSISIICFTTAQAQLAWFQHDAGHLSIFKKNWQNRFFHQILFCVMKGASARWWNHMHFQHHSKPNVIGKDPDVRLEALFVVGEEMPRHIAKSSVKVTVPYNEQHKYFFLIGPPLLFPVYFQYMTIRHVITRRLWLDGLLMALFFTRLAIMYVPLLGWWGLFIFFELCRVLESHWFTWVSQSNHIPMTIQSDEPQGRAWLKQQLSATCNIERSYFNDWFTGHLNHQIEHHLFPTMPRHNLYKIAPLVKSLCAKHNVEYRLKTLSSAFGDIVKSLKKSGQIWQHAYEEFHAT